MIMSERRLRSIIRSILLEGGIPQLSDFPADQYKKEEVKRLNDFWKEYDPKKIPDGFKSKEGPFEIERLQRAATILGCELGQLLIYLPTRVIDERKRIYEYDEDTAMEYADAYLAGVDPDEEGVNMKGYVLLDDVEIRYLYTCKEQEEEQEEKTKQLKMIKNKNK